ncbi:MULTISPECIES: hypothetical protein [Bacillaceae]|uniref:Uncharacterized protein n=1 Tax=Peribacillus huizhouensis TaxID=1501239 RepID=A0ABR6CJ60_9BACI|nr:MULTISPECIES: hypothetical protein [Bacillaceae]MBA9025087.1 hypothetical protein [Peribacillus huizhouensis]
MWELLLDFDYQTVLNAMIAGYILALFIPVVAVYIIHKNDFFTQGKGQDTYQILQLKHAYISAEFFERRGFQQFFIVIRRKESPDDSDEPTSLLIV